MNLGCIADSRMLLSSTVDYPIVVRYLLHLHCRNVQIAVCPSSQCPSPGGRPGHPRYRRILHFRSPASHRSAGWSSPLHIFWVVLGCQRDSSGIASHRTCRVLLLPSTVEGLIARGIHNDDDDDDDRRVQFSSSSTSLQRQCSGPQSSSSILLCIDDCARTTPRKTQARTLRAEGERKAKAKIVPVQTLF